MMKASAVAEERCVIVIPVYDDWEAASALLDRLDAVMLRAALAPAVLLVDDGSPQPAPQDVLEKPRAAIAAVRALELRRNLGNQRAIAMGLAYLAEHDDCQAVAIMDGDGEDAPEDVPRLLRALRENGSRAVVFAERRRRSEGLAFGVCYWLYRQAHRLLTGVAVRFGNFSVLPREAVLRLVTVPDLWNHYAAAVVNSRTAFEAIPTDRAPRLAGRSHMSFVALGVHGLSALSVFGERIGVRLSLLCGGAVVAEALAILSILGIRLLTPLAIPGWASTVAGLALLMLLQTIGFCVLFVFLVLQGRSQAAFLPSRDYAYFLRRVRTGWQAARREAEAGQEAAPALRSRTAAGAGMTHRQYIGGELALFQHAVHWKRYYRRHVARHLRGDVLEVGGGLGATARLLCPPRRVLGRASSPTALLPRRWKTVFATSAAGADDGAALRCGRAAARAELRRRRLRRCARAHRGRPPGAGASRPAAAARRRAGRAGAGASIPVQ